MRVEIDDAALVAALLEHPPRRERLPQLGTRRPDLAAIRRRKALYRALSCTNHELIEALLFSALTEPIYRKRGSKQPREPFEAIPEVARTAHTLFGEQWCLEEVRSRLLGLQQLWEALDHTAPDTWRARDVAAVICHWHQLGRGVAEIHRLIEGAEALWRSDPSEEGRERQLHFRNFLRGLVDVF